MVKEQLIYGESVTIGSIKQQQYNATEKDFYELSFPEKVQILKEGRYDEILMTSQVRLEEHISISERWKESKLKHLKPNMNYGKGVKRPRKKLKTQEEINVYQKERYKIRKQWGIT